MVSLAYWLETAKMNSDLTGNLLGGPLLGDLLARMDTAVSATNGLEGLKVGWCTISWLTTCIPEGITRFTYDP